jgi:hypothetical protein
MVGIIKLEKEVPSVLQNKIPRIVPVVIVAIWRRNGLDIVIVELD